MSEKIKRYELCEDVEVQTEESGYMLFRRGELDLVCKSEDVSALESELEKVKAERDRANELLITAKIVLETWQTCGFTGNIPLEASKATVDLMSRWLKPLNNEEEEK